MTNPRIPGRGHWLSASFYPALLLAVAAVSLMPGCQSFSGPGSHELTPRGQSPEPSRLDAISGRQAAGPGAFGQDFTEPEFTGGESSGRRATASDVIVDIRVEGNKTIDSGTILSRIKSQAGRAVDEHQIKEDLRELYQTRWFYNVERRFRATDDGVILVFRVLERPVVRRVELKGNSSVSRKQLLKQISIEPGSPFDVSTNVAAAQKIERYYRDKKSYPEARVTLESGADRDDRDVVFVVEEGPYTLVRDTQFVGNTIRSDVLRLHLKSKRTALGWIVNYSPFGALFGGKYNESSLPEDVRQLREYYHNLGYFDVEIEKEIKGQNGHIIPKLKLVKNPNQNQKWEHLPIPYVTFQQTKGAEFVYHINEGLRYELRDVLIEGNDVFGTEELMSEFHMHAGDKFNSRYLNKDVERMREKYGELGRLFASVEAVPRFIDGQPGVVDLVYKIDEDIPYEIRKINVNIHAPGGNPHTRETVVLNRMLVTPGELADPLLIDKSKGRLRGQIFESAGAAGPRISIQRVNHEEQSSLKDLIPRGQSPFDSQPVPYNPLLGDSNGGDPYGGMQDDNLMRALERPGLADLTVDVTEAQTGRLMFGVGVNSNAGLVGSFVIEENNFDFKAIPTSWRDFRDGSAFRGNGERFRIEAAPGQLFSRYLASWQTSNFMDTDFSLGLSGFFYNRFLPGWDEERRGGRISLGYQLDKWWSFTTAFRLEDVIIDNFATLTPPNVLQEANNHNFLSTVRTSVAHDTRDSSFIPTNGHFVDMAFEQAFGDFVYPRFEIQGTQYWTVNERADGGGRHVVSAHAEYNWSDSDTPIFERYFAGGYQSFRGFAFRGISPREGGIRVGGDNMILGSMEYSLPVTADEMFRVVGFVDGGTVENTEDDVSLSTVRLTAGFGMRLTIPAMGPAPLAFDFGFPILSETVDDKRVFSFYIGVTR